MISALRQFGITRLLASFVFGAVLLGCMYGFHRGWSSDGYRVPGALDLSGEWEFYNGRYSPYEALAMPFYQKVEVPKPLPAEIKTKLAEEFWYRKRFKLSKVAGPIAISLGSIKGEHEVYWNGKYLGGGGKTGVAAYRIPESYLQQEEVRLTVRVKRYDTLFPGIVHLNSIVLGDASIIDHHQTTYYFESGLKRLLSAIVKFVFAYLFLCLFLAAPTKREYLPFAMFALLSSAGAASTSKFLPIFDSFYLKSALQFLLSSLSLAMIPILSAAFLRMPDKLRSASRSYGFAIALIFILAAIQVRDRDQALNVYRMGSEWLPILAGIPSLFLCVLSYRRMDSSLTHRRVQIGLFGVSLLLGMFAGSSFASRFHSFQGFMYLEYLDLLVFFGLATSLVLDFKVISRRSERAGKAVPKWFAGFLAAGTARVQFDIPMVVIAVDTVGYTKKLSGLSPVDREALHEEIRSLLMPLTGRYMAQKLSDGGDGGIFGWDQPGDALALKQILDAVQYIAIVKGKRFEVGFRVGMAGGSVRCAMSGADFSFMGEALNSAARLESLAKPGEPLVDGTLANSIDPHLVSPDWVEAELKGVVYRGRALKLAA